MTFYNCKTFTSYENMLQECFLSCAEYKSNVCENTYKHAIPGNKFLELLMQYLCIFGNNLY